LHFLRGPMINFW